MIKYEIYAIYNILFSDNPFFKEVIAYVYCGLTDEEALRLASGHNINGHYTHEMTYKDYVSYGDSINMHVRTYICTHLKIAVHHLPFLNKHKINMATPWSTFCPIEKQAAISITVYTV